MSDDAPPPPDPAKPIPLSKAGRLEAKAARLRESEAIKAAQLASAPPAAPTTLSTRALIPWIAVVVFLVLALLGTLIYAAHQHPRATDARRAAARVSASASAVIDLDTLRDSALKTARTVATSFGSYSYKTLAADFARTRSYLTPSFAANFNQLTASLGALITQDKGETVGTVQGAGIQSITSTTAVVLVFLDQKVTSAESSTPRLDHNRLRLTMALQSNGHWLVSKLELV